MSAAGLTAYKLFRTLWPQKAIYEAVMEQVPELGLFKKDTNFYEKLRQIAVGTSTPQGIGPSFAIAKGDKVASEAIEFTCQTRPHYALFSLEGDLMRRSKSDKALLVDPIKRESRNIIKEWKLDVAKYLHGNGGGAYTQCVSTTGATFTIPVKDARYFRKNKRLWASSTDGTTGSAPSPTSYVTVTSVTRGATTAVITCDQTVLTVFPSMGSTPYLFRHGVFGNVLTGLEGWNPVTAPDSTLFKAVDRSVDTELLGGLRIDGRGMTPRAAAKAAAIACVDNWADGELLYLLSTSDWANLEADLDSAGSLQRTTVAATPIGKMNFGVSYDGIKMAGPNGAITVIASPNAPVGVGRMLSKDTWTLGSMGELLHPIDENDAEDGADAKEFRMIGDLEFYCEYPGANARVRLA